MSPTTRLPALALAAVFTLVMLLGVDTLASVDASTGQFAQRTTTSHS